MATVALAALAGGSAALSATVLIGSTIGSVLLTGPPLHLLEPTTGTSSPGSLLLSLLSIIALPLAARTGPGRPSRPAAKRMRDTLSSTSASPAVHALIWLVTGQAHLGTTYLSTGLALGLVAAASTATGAPGASPP